MIVPAMIPKSLEDLKEKLELLSFAKTIQVDVVDGKFVSSISWPYQPEGNVSEAASLLSNYEIEVDLMVADPLSAADDWVNIGAKRIVFHIESLQADELPLILKENNSVEIGLAINNDTPLEKLDSYIDLIDFVQMMGIATIGKQGEPFDERVIDRIATIHSQYPDLAISVDGAVNQSNLPRLKNAGATRFVVGSALLKSTDLEGTYTELLKIATN